MKVVGLRTIAGPSVFDHEPVLVLTLDLEDLAETPAHRVPGFVERLLRLLPGPRGHGRAGEDERLHDGAHLGRVVQHAVIDLSRRAGLDVTDAKTVGGGRAGRHEVVVRYGSSSDDGMRVVLHAAVDLVRGLLAGEDDEALAGRRDAAAAEASRAAADAALGPTTLAILRAAERRGLPWSRVGPGSLVQLGHGARLKFVEASLSHETRAIAVDVAGDKELTKTVLRRAHLPVPRGLVVDGPEAARAALASLRAPLAVKPIDGHHGQGVSLGVVTAEDMDEAFAAAAAFSPQVVVEEQLEGRDYRVLVIGGRLVAASVRRPAHVTGDGERTIAALVDAANAAPERACGHAGRLTRIVLDDPAALRCLRRRGLSPRSIPAAGVVVPVRETANLSTGGTARDVTAEVHPSVRSLCERAARIVGLDVAGIDLVVPDIAAPRLPDDRGGIIEVNAAPGLRMHHFPSEGAARDAGAAIVDLLFPPGSSGRIPIAAVTGTNGKTTTTRLTAHIVSLTGKVVGMTTSSGVYVGQELVAAGDCSGPASARGVLCDPLVDVAVLETARGGLLRGGLAYDWSDVGVITNVQPDHLGQDGVESLEDLLHVKSLVVERVRQGGTIVLNADDPFLARLVEQPRVRRLRRELSWVALTPDRPVVRRHLAAGGRAFLLRDGWLVEATGAREERVARVEDVPFTYGGTADFHVQNALLALATSRALGVDREAAARGLTSFEARRHNGGRANLFQAGGATVLVDYGHNPEAFSAVARMVSRWGVPRVTCVASVPGDRADWLIEDSGRVLGRSFDRVVVKEDADQRGRAPGVVARLVRDGVLSAAPGRECQVVLDERQALDAALRDARDGELVVVFYERLEVVLDVLRAWRARPLVAPPRRRGAA
jgi:cyanophycin synthetase